MLILKNITSVLVEIYVMVSQEWRFCCFITVKVMWCISVNNRTHAFTLSGSTQGQNAVSSSTGTLGPNSCNTDWLIIPCATNVGRTGLPACIDRICGGTFNTEISTTPATVISKQLHI